MATANRLSVDQSISNRPIKYNELQMSEKWIHKSVWTWIMNKQMKRINVAELNGRSSQLEWCCNVDQQIKNENDKNHKLNTLKQSKRQTITIVEHVIQPFFEVLFQKSRKNLFPQKNYKCLLGFV